MKPMVSVLMITYNHEKYIRQALESVFEQVADFEIEVVIGEDCSTDYTRAIVSEFEKMYLGKLIPIYHDKNVGMISNFFEHCLPKCTGKYIAVLEGDDYWTDSLKLQKQVAFLESKPMYHGCYHDTRIIYEDNSRDSRLFRSNLKECMTVEDTISTASPFHTSSFVFRKSGFTYPEFIHNVISGDMALFSIVAANGQLGKVDGVMSSYRKHKTGITSNSTIVRNFHKNRIELIQYLDEYHGFRYHDKSTMVIEFHKKGIDGISPIDKFKTRILAGLKLMYRVVRR